MRRRQESNRRQSKVVSLYWHSRRVLVWCFSVYPDHSARCMMSDQSVSILYLPAGGDHFMARHPTRDQAEITPHSSPWASLWILLTIKINLLSDWKEKIFLREMSTCVHICYIEWKVVIFTAELWRSNNINQENIKRPSIDSLSHQHQALHPTHPTQ